MHGFEGEGVSGGGAAVFGSRAAWWFGAAVGVGLIASLASMSAVVSAARAEDVPQPGVIIESSPNVTIGNVPVARQGDATNQGATVVTGSPDVFINGKPVALGGDKTGCNGIVIGSAKGVFINGKPVALNGDRTTGCPTK